MFDSLLDLFERDKRSSSKPPGGLRGRLASVLDGERDDDRHSDDRSRDRDRDDDELPATRKKKREFDFLEFGD